MNVALVGGVLTFAIQWQWVLVLTAFYFVYHLLMGVVRGGRGGIGPR